MASPNRSPKGPDEAAGGNHPRTPSGSRPGTRPGSRIGPPSDRSPSDRGPMGDQGNGGGPIPSGMLLQGETIAGTQRNVSRVRGRDEGVKNGVTYHFVNDAERDREGRVFFDTIESGERRGERVAHGDEIGVDGEKDLKRRIFLSERQFPNEAKVIGEREREDTEYVVVPRKVLTKEKVTSIPATRCVQEIVPQWTRQEVKRVVPKRVVTHQDHIQPVVHRQVIDEFVENTVDAGEETVCVPKIELQERRIEVSVPTVKIKRVEEHVPQVHEVVRYCQMNDGDTRQYVTRFVPETESDSDRSVIPKSSGGQLQPLPSSPGRTPGFGSGIGMSPGNLTPLLTTEELRQQRILQQIVLPKAAQDMSGAGPNAVITLPVPFMAPKPICIPIEVPVIEFKDDFVCVPITREVTPKLTFTGEVHTVECTRQNPVMIMRDHLKPVPVDTKIRISEKDVRVRPIDPGSMSQSDVHAMWMRVNADLLDKYKNDHGGKMPSGWTGPDSEKTPLGDTSWATSLQRQEAAAKEAADKLRQAAGTGGEDGAPPGTSPDGGVTDEDHKGEGVEGTLPLAPGNPLNLTVFQNKWIQTQTTKTHQLYTPEYFRQHYANLNARLDPKCHPIHLSDEQAAAFQPLPNDQLPNPWSAVAALRRQEEERRR